MVGGVGLIKDLNKSINHLLKKENSIILVIGKTFGHLSQSVFLNEIYSINEGPPPDINLVNEKNNGDCVLKLIDNNLINSIHDISTGGIILSLAEMSLHSGMGIKVNKPTGLSNIFEYFFGEDQGRYVVEIDEINLDKVKKILKENNIYHEVIGRTQIDYFEINKEIKLKTNDLLKLNNKWYYNY